MTTLLPWLVRYGHILGAATWVGGYGLLAFIIIPAIRKGASQVLVQVAITTVRVLTYTGSFTIGFGVFLITQTKDHPALFWSPWGGLIITGFVIAVVLLSIGDGILCPAILQLAKTGNAQAHHWAIIGFALTVVAVGAMAGATYVG